MEPPQQGKLLRAPSLKRGKTEESDRFQLNHVIGVTVTNNSALACDPNSNLIAYPSGCTIILHNTKIGYQQAHLVNTCRKTVTSLAFSTDGRYLVTGECGHAPCVRIWDLQNDTASNSTSSVLNCGTSNVAIQVAEFQAHQYGVNCVAFSPSNKYVVSVGSQHDMIVNVWDWKNNVKVASNKVSTKVKAIAFAENGSYFVTVGNRHIKFWYLEYSRNTKYKETVPLVGRAAILGSQQGQNFVAVACGRGDAADNTYAVTRSGLLCQLNNRRLLDKWLELRTTSANCMAVGENFIFVGCADGIVRCFNPSTLHFVTTLPRTHHLGVDVSEGLDISHMSRHPNNAKYPDTVAVAYDESNHKLTCIYNDHSIYVWDVRDIKRVGKSQSYLYHSACIWGIEMYPNQEETSLYGNHGSSILPEGSFITCSSDDTIRIWNLNTVGTGQTIRRNIYSNELLKVIYVDPELNYIKDQDLTSTGNNDKIDVSYDGKNGVRCIRIRPDGLHLASGDRAGNIRIHDMKTLQEIYKIEAHDAEVLCLEYSKCIPGENDFPRLLASASRDRLIHVFNVDDGYSILQTLDDHSSSITAVRFVNVGQQLKMISCGADKSIIFRNLNMVPGIPSLQFQRGQNVAGRTTLYDMETEVTGRHVLTVCQDRAVRIYSTRSGRYVRSLRGSPSEDGSLIKVTLDASGRYMATSCTDKTLSIYCAWSGQLLAYVCGHSELVTGLRFTHNGDQLISASGDAGILIWKHTQRKPYNISTEHETDGEKCNVPLPDIIDPNANISATNYRFSIGPLPLWAKKQINEDVPQLDQVKSLDYPKGRWAQRVEQGGITVKSVYDSDSIIPFPNPQDTIHDSDASKDSSIDSGTESRNFSEYRKETATVKFKQSFNSSSQTVTMTRGIGPRPSHHTDDSSLGSMLGSSAIGGDTGDSAAEHDGDVEDCSDAEGLRRSTNINSSITNTKFYPDAGSAIDSPSEFTVNAMSVDELRKSQRKNKNKRLELPLISISTTSVSGSQESDFDDDDASTPSGDNTDKNPISLLSASIESLDTIGQRTKYLQSAFDSLSGAEQEISPGKTTLSALHHNTRTNSSHETPPRNISVANSVTQGKNENEAYKTREELTRIVAETRRKLQSVGFKSNLKSSQSTMDLRRIPDKETRIEQKRNTISSNESDRQKQKLDDSFKNNNTNNICLSNINKRNFNIPANVNIKSNFKNLPFFSNTYEQDEVFSDIMYSTMINKFNEDMRQLVSQTSDDFITVTDTNKLKSSEERVNTFSHDGLKRKDDSSIDKDEVGFKHTVPSLPGYRSNDRPTHLGLNINGGQRHNSIFKKHKSLPVSPVTEETKLSDYCDSNADRVTSNLDLRSDSAIFGNDINLNIATKKRENRSFYVDFSNKLKKSEIEVGNEENDDEDGNFSSDSLEDCSLASGKNKKYSKTIASRRCFSNFEIYDEANNDYNASTIDCDYFPRSSSVLLKRVVTQSRESIDFTENYADARYSPSNYRFDEDFDPCKYSRETYIRSKNYWLQYLNKDNEKSNAEHISPTSKDCILNNRIDRSIFDSKESDLNSTRNLPQDNYNIYPEYERHSSASFYLRQRVPNSNSQESILSNFSDSADNSWKGEGLEIFDGGLRSNNSLESILSDESLDTRSAPLEILFVTHRRRRISESESDDFKSKTTPTFSLDKTIDRNNDIRQKIMMFEPDHKVVTRSKSFQEPRKKNIAFFIGDTNTTNCKPKRLENRNVSIKKKTDFSTDAEEISTNLNLVFEKTKLADEKFKSRTGDDIPTLRSKNDQYIKKGNDFWTNKIVAKSKSCSFEVMLDKDVKTAPKRNIIDKESITSKEKEIKSKNPNLTTKSLDRYRLNATRVKTETNDGNKISTFTTRSLDRNNPMSNNRDKFQRDRGFETLLGDVVKHKPPKGVRRTASAKVKQKRTQENVTARRNSDTFGHSLSDKKDFSQEKRIPLSIKSPTDDNVENQRSSPDIKCIELSFEEPPSKTGICESYEEKTDMSFVISPDESYLIAKNLNINDPNIAERDFNTDTPQKDSYKRNFCIDKTPSFVTKPLSLSSCSTIAPLITDKLTENIITESKIQDTRYLSTEDITKFRDIERKIEIINKLVEIEEAKISEGKVKRLSKNFELLAAGQKNEIETFPKYSVKRNLSLPTIFQQNLSLFENDPPECTRNSEIKENIQKIKTVWPPPSPSVTCSIDTSPHSNHTLLQSNQFIFDVKSQSENSQPRNSNKLRDSKRLVDNSKSTTNVSENSSNSSKKSMEIKDNKKTQDTVKYSSSLKYRTNLSKQSPENRELTSAVRSVVRSFTHATNLNQQKLNVGQNKTKSFKSKPLSFTKDTTSKKKESTQLESNVSGD